MLPSSVVLDFAEIEFLTRAPKRSDLNDITASVSYTHLDVYKRQRNHRSGSKARSADAVTYKLATAFEALVGFLHLDGQEARLTEIMERAVKEIES